MAMPVCGASRRIGAILRSAWQTFGTDLEMQFLQVRRQNLPSALDKLGASSHIEFPSARLLQGYDSSVERHEALGDSRDCAKSIFSLEEDIESI